MMAKPSKLLTTQTPKSNASTLSRSKNLQDDNQKVRIEEESDDEYVHSPLVERRGPPSPAHNPYLLTGAHT